MSRIASRAWNRLKREMRLRAYSAAAFRERLMLSTDRGFLRGVNPEFHSVRALLEHVVAGLGPALPFNEHGEASFLETLRCRYSEGCKDTLAADEEICRHRFVMLGQEFSFPGDEMNWNVTPTALMKWPRGHVSRIGKWLWSEMRTADWIPLWELNRHQFFVTLGKAYWLTGDERYSSEFCRQVESWIRQNPFARGLNWYSAMEVAIRLISWSIAFAMFRTSRIVREQCGVSFLKSLHLQTVYLRAHLTPALRPRNNHIIGEAAGLLTVGVLFPEFAQSAEWTETGLSVLEDEAERQTWEDGVNKEQTTGYHRFVLDLLLWVLVLQRRGVCRRSATIEGIVERMLDYTLYAMTPDGRLPQIGDCGEGRGFRFSVQSDYWDPRPLLAVGAVLFQRPDFKFGSGKFSEESFWLLGEEGLRAFEEMPATEPAVTSRPFWKGGHFFLRQAWDDRTDYLMLRAGEYGLGGEGLCAHAHCDLLSFVLWMNGEPIVVDSGTYSYHGPWRDRFRLTAAHNTIRIDELDQAVPLPDFSWTDIPTAACRSFGPDHVEAGMCLHGVTAKRTVRHLSPGHWYVIDSFSGADRHSLQWSFNFFPDLELEHLDSSVVCVQREGTHIASVRVPSGIDSAIATGWCSLSYGSMLKSSRLEASWCGPIAEAGVEFEWRFDNNSIASWT